jgi:DNA-binding transcriptional MerR regulator
MMKVISRVELAKLLNIHPRHITRLARTGRIPGAIRREAGQYRKFFPMPMTKELRRWIDLRTGKPVVETRKPLKDSELWIEENATPKPAKQVEKKVNLHRECRPNQSQVDQLKQLIERHEAVGTDSVNSCQATIAISVKIGRIIEEWREDMGEGWREWREANIPEVARVERGSVKLARLRKRTPDMFNDCRHFLKLSRLAGTMPPVMPPPHSGPKSRARILRDHLRRAKVMHSEVMHPEASEAAIRQGLDGLWGVLGLIKENHPWMLKEKRWNADKFVGEATKRRADSEKQAPEFA